MIHSSDEAAIIACGSDAVRNYQRVKRFFTHFGHELEHSFALAVNGDVRQPPEPDVVTRLGGWEFCTQANTKNSSGAMKDMLNVPAGHLVQVLGHPRVGWISGAEFLRVHGVEDPEARSIECIVQALSRARDHGEQLALV